MRKLIRILAPILKLFFSENPRGLLAGALLSAATVIAGLALLGLSGWFITAASIAGLSATAVAFDVFAPAAAIRLLAISRTAARYGERMTTHDATLGILAALRETLFRGWAAPDAARNLLRRPSKALFRLTADIDALDSLYLRILVPIGAAIGAAVVAVVTLGIMHPAFGLTVGAVLLGSGIWVPIVAGGLASKPARRRAYGIEALRSRAIDLTAGQTDLMMASRIKAQCASVLAADRYTARADRHLNRIETGVTLTFGLGTAILLAGSLLAVAALAEVKAITAPVAALGLLIAFAAVEPFTALRRGALEFGRVLVAAKRIGPRLTEETLRQIRSAPEAGIALGLQEVSVRHDGCAADALHAISLELRLGEALAVIGPSGAGKSTLLSLLADEIEPRVGTAACVDATLLTQKTELFQDTLEGNLRLAKPEASDAELREALVAAGLLSEVEALPKGLGTPLGEGGFGLSGGQSRRLALARLFLRDTPLWLLDEATEGLDSATASDVMSRLKDRAYGRSLVIACHARREAAIADQIAVIKDGRITELSRRGEAAFERALERLRPD
ncbi:cysteine ABC transporter ATP-binding/permease subunit CydC (plasmid) [Rhizobium gallicum bv. gallicum R602sp]|uniref:Cysteine ABC transporter ATP-binding/permease subunit CydC n=1 Tax=Rhizobium gallicum bv. gallicum R602sp TaxID=1041138 RepID=A0A0B4XFJ6_9HYPH|nr:ATP-binding cassette domain-containing protein [Rhizobium gallicum]AJD45252.1 cysteine ABC transporter ATP-binding/permease subunit CydC [Rhizobium gallicum bv. gallicum R602sp]